MRPTISVTINTLNEEANIGECIASVQWADEIVVVDMHSDDRTVEIAQSMGAKTFLHERLTFADPARDFAFAQATGDWIFMVDADERVPEALAQEVRRRVDNATADAYNVARKNLVFGRWMRHSYMWPDYQLRLFRRGLVSWPDRVHDRPTPEGPVEDLPADEELALVHRSGSYQSVRGFAERYFLAYAPLEVEVMHRANYRFRRRHVFVSPLAEFRFRFLTHKGYRDGFDGLAIAGLHAAYRLCTVLYYWERYHPNLPDDRDQSLVKFMGRVLRGK